MPSLVSALLALLLIVPTAWAGGHELGAPPLGSSPYRKSNPLVAYAGGQYLTVWAESFDLGGSRVVGAYSDRNGMRLSPLAFVIAGDITAAPTQLLSVDDSFVLVFPAEHAAVLLFIDGAGHVTATHTVPIERFHYYPALAWNGTHFVAVEKTRALFFDRNGEVTDRITLTCELGRRQLLAVGTDVIVAGVCSYGGGLRADRIASNGAIVRTLLDPEVLFSDVHLAATRAANGSIFMAWGTQHTSPRLRTAVVAPDGSYPPPHTIAIATYVDPLAVARTADGFLLPYIGGGLHVATLADDGSLLADDDSQVTSRLSFARAASDGTKILVSDVEFLTADASGRVRTRRIEAGAPIVTTGIISISPASQFAPAIAAGSGSLVAVWTEREQVISRIRVALLDARGVAQSSSVLEESGTLVSRDLAWNGSEYLTVIRSKGYLRTQRINAFGERVGNSVRLRPTMSLPPVAVVWSGDRWELVGADAGTTFHLQIAADGTVLSSTTLTLEGTPSEDAHRSGTYDVALARHGGRTYVAWIEGQYVPCSFECIEARLAFVRPIDGTREPLFLGDAAERLSLASNGNALVATSTRYDRSTVATSFDGSLRPIATRTFDGAADVTWDGGSFVLALRELTRLTIRRVDASLRDAGPAHSSEIGPADTRVSMPSIAVAISGNAIAGIQEIEADSGARAVAYAEQELGYEPQRRRTVRR